MTNGGFFDQKRSSPTSLIVIVAAHAAAITALAFSKVEVSDPFKPGPIKLIQITPEKDPPPIPPEPIKTRVEPKHRSVVDTPKREVVTTKDTTPVFASDDTLKPLWSDTAVGTIDIPKVQPLPPPPPQPVPDPVRTEARLKPGIELLPPYPAAEERAQAEGSVTVRLLIGTDGRVKVAERVRAESEAFWRATERHALRAWRFTPATVDGKPVESRKTMTVHFELRG
jgi:protein TonB